MPASRDNPTVCLVSLGCPKNLVDSEKILAILAAGGCIVGAPMEDADVIVINTCAFISSARDEAWQFIDEALECKSSGRARRIVVAGCLASRDGQAIYERRSGIDAVVSVANRDDILPAVLGAGRFTRLGACDGQLADDRGRFRLTPPHTAYLRISEGCSRKCTYCTIPALRGPGRSKRPADVVAEAGELIDNGAVELNVIAQDTTAYGQDFAAVDFAAADFAAASGAGPAGPSSTRLPGLLRMLDGLDGVQWIRLLYTHPASFTDELVDTIAECSRVVPYVDIPLQHICDPILDRMGRGVRRRQIERLLGRLRDRVEGITLRTTFIVGFPGESDGQFAELLQFVRQFRFEALGAFEFSPEAGTPAAGMPGQVPPAVKADRARQIMLAQQEIVQAANRRAVGRDVRVLVDGRDGDDRCVGRHCGQAPDVDSLCLLTGPAPAGSFIDGTVRDFDGYDLIVDPR